MRYSAREKRYALKLWQVDKMDILLVAKKMKCTQRSLWRWKALYDGTLESLENKSTRPKTPHPTAHTPEERDCIVKLFKRKPEISYGEAFGILRTTIAYSRSYGGFYNFVLRNNLRPTKKVKKEIYVPQPYDTPIMFGTKIQIDVKFVPRVCKKGKFAREQDYQYTAIDEATRERFIFPYAEHSGFSTVDFIKRAITYFGYIPQIIQTDNGTEFTNPHNVESPKIHIVDMLCNKLGIKHQLIRPRTPRLNGKVERSHRSDQESFYNYLTYETMDELKKKMLSWNIRYNNRPHSALRNKFGKKVWLSPIEKRTELEELLQEKPQEFDRIRYIKPEKHLTIRKTYAL